MFLRFDLSGTYIQTQCITDSVCSIILAKGVGDEINVKKNVKSLVPYGSKRV